ncbi:uncharacterized protein LOC144436075 [Glandiceps talaboti]
MAKSLFFPSLITLYFTALAAADLDISSKKSTYEVGETILMNCTTTTESALDVEWYFNSNLIPEDSYNVLPPNLSQLVITNVSFSNAGNYSCVLLDGDDRSQSDIDVKVGVKPFPAVNFSCHSFNADDILCTWDEGGTHNIPTNYTFMYKASYKQSGVPDHPSYEWTECPDRQTSTNCPGIHNFTHSCFLKGFYDHIGSRHNVSVTASNELGTRNVTLDFNPDIEATPFPPSNIIGSADGDGCLKTEWDLPCGWNSMWVYLQYKLRYKSEWESEQWDYLQPDDHQSKKFCRLDGYTHYDIQVAAAVTGQQDYWSEWSDTITVRTQEQAPDALLQVTVSDEKSDTENSRNVTVKWMPLTDRQMKGAVLRYTVKLLKGDTFEELAEVNKSVDARQHRFEDLRKYRSYQISVVVWNSVGSSPPGTVEILDLSGAPSEPVNVNVTNSNKTSIMVTWDPPLKPRGEIIKYQVRWKGRESWSNATIYVAEDTLDNLQYQITGLQEYVQYEIQVQAFTTAGQGGFSQVIHLYTSEGVPSGSAKDVMIVPLANSHRLDIVWQPPCLDERNGIITGYLVYYCEAQEFSSEAECHDDMVRVRNISVDSTAKQPHVSTEIDELKPYTLYAVWLAAYTKLNIPGPNSTKQINRTSQGAPSAPIEVSVFNKSAADIVIVWQEPKELNGVIERYEIKVDGRDPTKAYKTKFVLGNLYGHTEYTIKIRACTEAASEFACGPYSNQVSATTDIGVPGKPPSPKVVATTSRSVTLSYAVPDHPNGPLDSMYYTVFSKRRDGKTWIEYRGVYQVEGQTTVLDVNCDDGDDAQDYVFALRAQININGDIVKSDIGDPSQPVKLCHYSADVVLIAALTTVLAIIAITVVSLAVCAYRKYKKSDLAKPIPEVKLPESDSHYRVTINPFNFEEEYDLLENQTRITSTNNGVTDYQQNGHAVRFNRQSSSGLSDMSQTSQTRLIEEGQAPIDEDEDDVFPLQIQNYHLSKKRSLKVQLPGYVNIDGRSPSIHSPDSGIGAGSSVHPMNMQGLGQYVNVNGRLPSTPGPDSGFSPGYSSDSIPLMGSNLPHGRRPRIVSEYLQMSEMGDLGSTDKAKSVTPVAGESGRLFSYDSGLGYSTSTSPDKKQTAASFDLLEVNTADCNEVTVNYLQLSPDGKLASPQTFDKQKGSLSVDIDMEPTDINYSQLSPDGKLAPVQDLSVASSDMIQSTECLNCGPKFSQMVPDATLSALSKMEPSLQTLPTSNGPVQQPVMSSKKIPSTENTVMAVRGETRNSTEMGYVTEDTLKDLMPVTGTDTHHTSDVPRRKKQPSDEKPDQFVSSYVSIEDVTPSVMSPKEISNQNQIVNQNSANPWVVRSDSQSGYLSQDSLEPSSNQKEKKNTSELFDDKKSLIRRSPGRNVCHDNLPDYSCQESESEKIDQPIIHEYVTFHPITDESKMDKPISDGPYVNQPITKGQNANQPITTKGDSRQPSTNHGNDSPPNTKTNLYVNSPVTNDSISHARYVNLNSQTTDM